MGLTYRGVYTDEIVDSYGRAIFDEVNLRGSACFSDILLVQLYGNCISGMDAGNTIHISVHARGNILSEPVLNGKIQVEIPVGPNIMGNIISQGILNTKIYSDINRQLIPHPRSVVLRDIIITNRPLRT